MIDLHLSKNR